MTGALFAAFAGGALTVAFLTTDCFAAAFFAAHLFFRAAMMLARPALLNCRLGFGVATGAGVSDPAPNLGPSTLLGFLHAPSSGSGEFLSLTCGNFRRSGGLSRSARKQCFEFCDFAVDACLLFLEAVDGGGDDLVCEFWWQSLVSLLSGSDPNLILHPLSEEKWVQVTA